MRHWRFAERSWETEVGDMNEQTAASLSFHVRSRRFVRESSLIFPRPDPRAGSVPRPPVDVDPSEIRQLALHHPGAQPRRRGSRTWAKTPTQEPLRLRHDAAARFVPAC